MPGLHGSAEEDVISAILEEILTRPALGSHLYYFTGQRGTGKSTELRRLESDLLGEGAQVIRFDSLDFITETEKITVESVLLLVTAGLAAWADDAYQQDFLIASAWTRFSNWLQTDVELTEVSAKGLKLKLKEQQVTVAEKIRKLATPLEWTKKVQEFAGEIVQFIRERTQRERVVVIVDSLERLRGVAGADQDTMFQHVVMTFAGDFDRLRVPGASVVYSVPPYLALLADVRSFVTCHALASVRVYCKPIAEGGPSPDRRQPRPEGLAKMRGLIERRYGNWAQVIERPVLDALALASGGDLRHFMQRLVSGVVGQAQFALDRVPLKVEDPIVRRVLDENRGETERLTVRSEWVAVALGRLEEAQTAYTQSEQLRRELIEEFGKTPERLRDLSVSQNKLGDVARALGRLEEAQTAYTQGEQLARQLIEEFGKTPERLRDLSISQDKLGDLARALGRLDEAQAAYSEGVALAREMELSYGETVSALEVLAVGLQHLGEVQIQQGDANTGESNLAEAAALRQRLALTMPHEQRYRSSN